ncbi:helix-turn-helix domain-containing protein [Lysinibacillus sp. 38-6]|uniref:helix-turn-helix domain-containing protein n=1 Tax=Lysinibacillus sp. 38-6 TaxID=3385991 RepID=UPI0039088A55
METREKKKKVVELYQKGELSHSAIARELKINKAVVSSWLAIYKYHGLDGLLAPPCKSYDDSFKLEVIHYLIETVESYTEVSGRFNLHSRATLWKWMHLYMTENDWALYHKKRERRDMKKKSTTTTQNDTEKLQEELELLRAENAYLKKLHALIQEKEKLARKKKS